MVNVPAASATVGHWYILNSSRTLEHIVDIDSCGGSHPLTQKFWPLSLNTNQLGVVG